MVLVLGSGVIATRKGFRLRSLRLRDEASLLIGTGIFLILAFLTLFQFTPFLYRFPIAFLVYTLCAVALYYPMPSSAAQEQSQ